MTAFSQVEISPEGRVETLKLGDFGLACEVGRPLLTVCGTPTYVAPEILAETGYGLKVGLFNYFFAKVNNPFIRSTSGLPV